jgi:hypothetical protein
VQLKALEGSALGCQALPEGWTILADRIERGVALQPPDRLKAIRMLGKRPVDAALDDRVDLIMLASVALHPAGRKNSYDDFAGEMGTLDREKFEERVRSRGPLLLSVHDTEQGRQGMREVVRQKLLR